MTHAAAEEPSADAAQQVEQMMWLIRRSFQDMARVGDRLYADLGLTAAKRTVLEALDRGGDRTVPDIARERNVSRQHIQQLADALVADGLAAFAENPAHRRSQLLTLTVEGAAAFAELRRREAGPVATVAAVLEQADVRSCCATLARFRGALAALDTQPEAPSARAPERSGDGQL